MKEITTADLRKFGYREKAMAEKLLQAMIDQGLPEDFEDSEVNIMMNMNSGNVFLTNSEYQVAMLNGDTLESFYSTPYGGVEGFLEDLENEYEDMCNEDKKFIDDIKKRNKK